MKRLVKYLLVTVITILLCLPAQHALAAEDSDAFLFSDATKDLYQGQSVICIAKDTTFYENDTYTYDNVKKITFDEDVETLPSYVFYQFPNVEEIELPEGLESVSGAFYPYNYYYHTQETKYILTKLKKLSVPVSNPYFTVEDDVLYSKDMTVLILYPAGKQDKAFEIPEFVTQFYGCAFLDNHSLEKIVIGARLKGDFESNFASNSYLPNLKKFVVDSQNPYLSTKDGVLFNHDMTELLAYPNGLKKSTYQVPNGTLRLADYCFSGATIQKIILPSKIESFSYSFETSSSPFEGCHVTSLEIKDNANYTTVNGVLYNKEKTQLIYWPSEKVVKTLTFPSTLKSISLSNNIPCISKVTTLTIPKALEEIIRCNNMDSLSTIKIEKGNKKFNVYSGCLYTNNYKELVIIPPKTTQTSITVAKSFKTYSYNIDLKGASKVTTLVFNGNAQNFPFNQFPNLSAIKVSKNSKSLKASNGVLYTSNMKTLVWYPQCKKDTKFTVPSSVTSIKSETFATQKYLQSITLPKNLKVTEPEYTQWFIECKKLKEIKVATGNKYLTAVNGVLFNKNMTTLICYPAGKTAKSYTVPEKTTTFVIKTGNPYLTTLTLSKKMEKIQCNHYGDDSFIRFTKLKSITVASGNENFSSENGVLYGINYDGRTLVAYPMGKTDKSFTIPEDVSSIWCEENFKSQPYLKTLKSLSPTFNVVGKELYYAQEEYY